MDNINVIRVGFFAPAARLADTEMEIGDPVDRISGRYSCLAFVNPDDEGARILTEIERGLPASANRLDWNISAIVPLKPKSARAFKENRGIGIRLFCDADLKAGKLYVVVNSASARPAYHPTIFVVGDEGSVRYRQTAGNGDFDLNKFLASMARII
jgi:hypothetical protein